MRIFNLCAITLVAFATLISSVSANPYDEMSKVQAAMGRVHSYKTVATWSAAGRSATAQIEALTPNRYHSTLFGGALQFIVIGSQYWVKSSRQPWTRLKSPPVMSLVGNLQAVSHFKDASKFNVHDLGMRAGYHAFAVNEKAGQNTKSVVYVRRDYLVARVDTQAGANRGTITYTAYNAPVSIQPPGR